MPLGWENASEGKLTASFARIEEQVDLEGIPMAFAKVKQVDLEGILMALEREIASKSR